MACHADAAGCPAGALLESHFQIVAGKQKLLLAGLRQVVCLFNACVALAVLAAPFQHGASGILGGPHVTSGNPPPQAEMGTP